MDVDKLVPEAGNLAGFIEQFPVFANSPNGIEKLRNLILDLASRGKLVDQNLNDNSIEELCREIAAEKDRLVKEKKIRKPKKLPDISNKEKSFKIPNNWRWFRLEELYFSISPSGKKIKNSEINEEGEYPVVDQGKKFIAGYTNNAELLIKIPKPVIIFGDHTTEKKYINFDFVAGADGTKILCPYSMNERFFYTCLLSYKLENRGYARHFKVLNANLMALPPLEEQKRIVAKVDELMALCDKLEAQQQQQAHNVLQANTAAIHALLNPEPPQTEKTQQTAATVSVSESQIQFEKNWQRIAQHFNTLYGCTLPMPDGEGRKKKHLVGLENVKALRQVIVQLAITGKLTTQNPKESASRYLESLAKEAKGAKKGIDSEDKEYTFRLPSNWKWTNLNLLSSNIHYGYTASANHDIKETRLLRITDIQNDKVNWDSVPGCEIDSKKLSSNSLNNGDLLIARTGGTVGKTYLVSGLKVNAVFASYLIRLKPHKNTWPEYIKLFTLSYL